MLLICISYCGVVIFKRLEKQHYGTETFIDTWLRSLNTVTKQQNNVNTHTHSFSHPLKSNQ